MIKRTYLYAKFKLNYMNSFILRDLLLYKLYLRPLSSHTWIFRGNEEKNIYYKNEADFYFFIINVFGYIFIVIK